jgi:hypothetical protein
MTFSLKLFSVDFFWEALALTRFCPLYNKIPRHGFAREGLIVAYLTLLDRIERRRKRVLIWEELALRSVNTT